MKTNNTNVVKFLDYVCVADEKSKCSFAYIVCPGGKVVFSIMTVSDQRVSKNLVAQKIIRVICEAEKAQKIDLRRTRFYELRTKQSCMSYKHDEYSFYEVSMVFNGESLISVEWKEAFCTGEILLALAPHVFATCINLVSSEKFLDRIMKQP